MKALVLKAIKQPLELQERPPLVAGPGQVIVMLKAAALNRRDFWITQGLYPGIKPPVVLGSDGAGVVTEVGAGVEQAWLEREVLINPGLHWGGSQTAQGKAFTILGLPTDGTFATEVEVPVSQISEKPTHLSWREAASLPLAGLTAYRALFEQGGLRAGETVLITGAGGGVASLALQFAVAAGARAWVTSSTPGKISKAMSLGAIGGLNYKDQSWPRELTRSAGAPHLIIDSAGGADYASLIDVAAPGARIISYGATNGPVEKLDLFKVFWKQLRLQGSTLGSPADFSAMLQFVIAHKIRPIIEAAFSLDEGSQAIQSMAQSSQFGKYVLDIESAEPGAST